MISCMIVYFICLKKELSVHIVLLIREMNLICRHYHDSIGDHS